MPEVPFRAPVVLQRVGFALARYASIDGTPRRECESQKLAWYGMRRNSVPPGIGCPWTAG